MLIANSTVLFLISVSISVAKIKKASSIGKAVILNCARSVIYSKGTYIYYIIYIFHIT